MKRSELAFLIALLMCALVITPVAQSHTYIYLPYEWQDTSIVYHFTPTVPTSGYWREAFRNAASRWSNISLSDGFFFEDDAPDISDDWNCDYSGTNTVKRRAMDGAGDTLGVTKICLVGSSGSAHIVEFKLHIDSAEDWYVKSDTPSTPLKIDLQGVATHEFGHVAGWEGEDREPSPGGAFDPINDPNQCDAVNGDAQGWHTMCYRVFSSNESWRWRSLETHDIHEFTQAYP